MSPRRVLDVFDLAGARILRYESNRFEEPPSQIRCVNVDEETAKSIRSIEDAERLGRTDLIRCFLLDSSREPWCYREQLGGHDRFPEVTDPAQITQMQRDFGRDPDLHTRQLEVYEAFPEGEITGLRSVVLAWLERDGRVDWSLEGMDWGEHVIQTKAATDCAIALERIGYLKRTALHAWDFSGALAAMPRLHRRLLELREKAKPT